MIKIHYFIIAIIVLSSCHKSTEELENGDYLIFGHFYGECLGEQCVETYKLSNTKLYEDVADDYGHASYNFVELSNSDFNKVKDLVDYFPTQLWNETETILGCPDCYDQGGVFIEYKKDGAVKSWRIDNDLYSIPSYLHAFMNEVNGKIDSLNN